MAARTIIILCAQALLIQSALSQCVNRGMACEGLGWNRGLGYPGPLDYTSTSGGLLPIASSSCLQPTGISVVSENFFEGTLSVIGELPFIGAVALEGTLPTAGAGAINYGCGNGFTGMLGEGVGPGVGIPAGAGIPPARLGYGYGCGDILY